MKRLVSVLTLGLALVVPAVASARTVAVARTTGYAHASVSRTAVVRTGCCYGGYSPVGTAARVATGVAVGTAVGNAISHPVPVATPTTTVAVGTIVPALPGGCGTTQVNGITYHQCSGVYYRPYYQGSTLVYQVSQP
jgi:hypothetical protein